MDTDKPLAIRLADEIEAATKQGRAFIQAGNKYRAVLQLHKVKAALMVAIQVGARDAVAAELERRGLAKCE